MYIALFRSGCKLENNVNVFGPAAEHDAPVPTQEFLSEREGPAFERSPENVVSMKVLTKLEESCQWEHVNCREEFATRFKARLQYCVCYNYFT